jgi:hypothetical protein
MYTLIIRVIRTQNRRVALTKAHPPGCQKPPRNGVKLPPVRNDVKLPPERNLFKRCCRRMPELGPYTSLTKTVLIKLNTSVLIKTPNDYTALLPVV